MNFWGCSKVENLLLVDSSQNVAEGSIGSEVEEALGGQSSKGWLHDILSKGILLKLDQLGDSC